MIDKKNKFKTLNNISSVENNKLKVNKKNKLNKKFKDYKEYLKFKRLEIRKEKTPKLVNYLHLNKKLKQGVFLKKPNFNEIKYPFFLNFKLINEFIKKK